jgi:hypothetical protein
MRRKSCPFCNNVYDDKQKFCHHIVNRHNDQIPEECKDGLEYAYSLLVGKEMGRLCTQCHNNPVHFNDETLKYERLCSRPECKEAYVRMMKDRMKNVYGKEHLLNDADMQRKMIHNHANAKDYVWDEQHKFRVIGTYEVDFLDHLKSLDWSPNDIIAPSPNNYWYKWSDGTTHLYIPDFYIPSLSLEVEIKQGGYNDSFMVHNREIEHKKDLRMQKEASTHGIYYIKILDKNYDEFDKEFVKSDTNNPE